MYCPTLLIVAPSHLTCSVDTNDDAFVRVEVSIDIRGSVEFLHGSFNPVLAEVLSLVVTSDLYHNTKSATTSEARSNVSFRERTAQSHWPSTQWKSWNLRRASAMMASFGVTSTPWAWTSMLRHVPSQASSEEHYIEPIVSLFLHSETCSKVELPFPGADSGCLP